MGSWDWIIGLVAVAAIAGGAIYFYGMSRNPDDPLGWLGDLGSVFPNTPLDELFKPGTPPGTTINPATGESELRWGP